MEAQGERASLLFTSLTQQTLGRAKKSPDPSSKSTSTMETTKGSSCNLWVRTHKSLPNTMDHQLPWCFFSLLYALDGTETPNIAAQKSLAYSLLAGKKKKKACFDICRSELIWSSRYDLRHTPMTLTPTATEADKIISWLLSSAAVFFTRF